MKYHWKPGNDHHCAALGTEGRIVGVPQRLNPACRAEVDGTPGLDEEGAGTRELDAAVKAGVR